MILLAVAATVALSSPTIATVSDNSAYARLEGAESNQRELACAELSLPENRGARARDALISAMRRDLTPRVRQCAATALTAYIEPEVLAALEAFFKSEPNADARLALVVALSTSTAYANNPDATRLLAGAMEEDSDASVRQTAATTLGARGDLVALGSLSKTRDRDKNADVRAAAEKSLALLSIRPKPKPKPKPTPPNPDAVKGRDPCHPPWGWCECAGAIKRPAKCLTRADCQTYRGEMRRYDLSCLWDGQEP